MLMPRATLPIHHRNKTSIYALLPVSDSNNADCFANDEWYYHQQHHEIIQVTQTNTNMLYSDNLDTKIPAVVLLLIADAVIATAPSSHMCIVVSLC